MKAVLLILLGMVGMAALWLAVVYAFLRSILRTPEPEEDDVPGQFYPSYQAQ